MTKRLIVTGDDLGLSSSINAGIADAYRNGILRSASILLGQPATQEGIEIAQDAGIEIGLHLNLTLGTCHAPPSSVPLLADSDGRFLFQSMHLPHAVEWLRQLVETKHDVLEQVRVEFEAQLKILKDQGIQPAFLNTHHYVTSMHPDLARTMLELASDLKIPARGHCWPISEYLGLDNSNRRSLQDLWCKSDVRTPFLSLTNLVEMADHGTSADNYVRIVEDTLTTITYETRPSVVELVVHPARNTDAELDDYAWARRLEFNLVLSERFRRTLSRLEFELMQFSKFSNIEEPE